MEGTSGILSLGIVVREVVLPQDLLGDAEDRMRDANGGSTRGWNKSKRGEVNAKGDQRQSENPKNSSHCQVGPCRRAASDMLRVCSQQPNITSRNNCWTRRNYFGVIPIVVSHRSANLGHSVIGNFVRRSAKACPPSAYKCISVGTPALFNAM